MRGTVLYRASSYNIVWAGVKFGINFTSCSENGSEIAQGTAKYNLTILATMSGIYSKISLLPMLRTNRVRCALNMEILDLLNEESVSGVHSGRASL